MIAEERKLFFSFLFSVLLSLLLCLEETEEGTAMPGAAEMLLCSLGLTSNQNCNSWTYCISRGKQLRW